MLSAPMLHSMTTPNANAIAEWCELNTRRVSQTDSLQGCASGGWKAAANLIVEGCSAPTGTSISQSIISEMAAEIEGE